ncbi:MAG: diguanylate cyclase [Leptothrix sp. (in: Bacteria)]|nr:diguanylate cyclase [Leptothrix sp. (in: b-proteobacteria)]
MAETVASSRLHKLEQLRAAYRSELAQRLEAMETCWLDVRGGHDAAARVEELQRLAHSLAGSAGTFGMAALGQAARVLELAISGLGGVATARDAQQRASIDADIAALRGHARQEPTAPAAAASPAARGGTAGEAENRLLFVIEDDAALAKAIATQLGAFGWNVQRLANATAAREALQGTRPAALIVDMTLPEGLHAGPELISGIQRSTDSQLPHVIVSSHWDWNSRLAAARSGAEAYFVKPVDFAALTDRLDTLTRRSPPQPYRVLIVEDTTVLAEHYAQVLADAGMEARVVVDATRLLEVLADFSPELVLMDLYMPACTGIEAARVVRQDPKFTGLPIVFLSTESGGAQQLAAMQTGADDFLEKPISDADLVAAVSVRAVRFRALAALIRQNSLTGLLNHITFKLQLEGEVSRVQRSGAMLTLAMLDIDLFKHVNDNHGHPVGDRVIHGLAQLLRKRLRRCDVIGRCGGEEFGVLMPDTPLAVAVRVMDAVREQFGHVHFASAKHGPFRCTFSAGLAAFSDGVDEGSLLRTADEAPYVAKRSGRNRVCAAAGPQ